MAKTINIKAQQTIPMDIDVSTRSIAHSLVKSLTKKNLIEFIQSIDEQVADLDFTIKIRDHFISEVEKETHYHFDTKFGEVLVVDHFTHIEVIIPEQEPYTVQGDDFYLFEWSDEDAEDFIVENQIKD